MTSPDKADPTAPMTVNFKGVIKRLQTGRTGAVGATTSILLTILNADTSIFALLGVLAQDSEVIVEISSRQYRWG